MAFTIFKPTLWSARLLANLDKNLVALNIVNCDYEGEISAYGDKVKINQFGNVTIKEYTGADIDAPEEVEGSQQELEIDQAKYFNFQVKDVDKAQANVNLVDGVMARASYAMAEVVDTDIFKIAALQAGIRQGDASAPIEITVNNAYDKLVELGVLLSTKNVPKANRKIVLPPWYFGFLARDVRFTKDLNILANGVAENATVGGFQLLESNNLLAEANGGAVHSIGVGMAVNPIQFANQVVETEAYRPEKNFSDAVKGLNVWGRKVTQADAVVDFVIVQSNPS
ncbi:P22 coat protein - protein 5 domain protein [Bacillus cereus]|uniref:P22 coat protein-protein 5 domain protein n=1 Tax=Bacillus cereus TaxID=1396 RepID=A0A9X7GX83_BACCE|nr:P22 phage major capsid protein family protein [Bacillus cereus]PGS81638.1 P22 coat protein - protein 5 domain protein [Bacillus cereus]